MGTQPIRIGLVIGQLSYGGAESQVYELARGVSKRHAVKVYCLSEQTEPYGARLRAAGVEVSAFPSRRSLDVSRVLALRRGLAQDRIEVVHAFLYIASAYAYLATRGPGRPRFIASARNCKLESGAFRRWLLRRAFGGADAVICNSREMATFAAAHYGAPASRTTVVYNGVEAGRFDVPRRQHAGLRIGTIGRLEAQKNLELFVRAAEKVAASRSDATFEIAGSGSLGPRIERLAAQLGLSGRLRLCGPVADVPGFLAGLDQFWLTSDFEGTPNVVLEAMAAGVPVVATAVGGTPEILGQGALGRLVPPRDVDALVAASLELAADPGSARALAARARAAVSERFSISAMVAATEGVYRSVLRGRA